jgi:hypothetical protein
VLERKFGQEAEIPYIFRSGKLRQPELDTIEKDFERRQQRIENRYLVGQGLEVEMDIDDEDVFNLGKNGDGQLIAARDKFGRIIEDIPQSNDMALLMEKFEVDSNSDEDTNNFENSQEILLFNNRVNKSNNVRPQTGKVNRNM